MKPIHFLSNFMRKSFGAKTIIHTTPVWIVCAYDTDGQPSGATVAWGGVCSSNPPSLSVSLRAATYTHKCIKTSGAFTVNVPSEDFVIEKRAIIEARRSLIECIASEIILIEPEINPANNLMTINVEFDRTEKAAANFFSFS